MTIALWPAVAFAATARGSSVAGTSDGSSVCCVGSVNARAAPITTTSAKIARSVIVPLRLSAASVTEALASMS